MGNAIGPMDFRESRRGIDRRDDSLLQLPEPITASGDGFDHRHTKPLRQEIHIDANAIALRGITLVQSDQCRNTQLRALRDKQEIALEICRIEDKDQQVRLL